MTNRYTKKYPLIPGLVEQIQQWAAGHTHFQYLNGNGHSTGYGTFPHMIFVGKQDLLTSRSDSFEKLGNYLKKKHWLYGYFSYELKNEIEKLQSANPATIAVDHLSFAVPDTMIKINRQDFEVDSVYEPDDVFWQIETTEISLLRRSARIEDLKTKTTKDQYIDNVNKIKRAIVEGEYYEMNYCIEYTTLATDFNPVLCYQRLNDISPMPFSALMKIDNIYLICASPERFLKKIGNKIISQPIKGTIRRSTEKGEDAKLKKALFESEKEQAENLMIVDLVRNDLARSSETGTVKVEELFGIYTFKRVHQMISTVTSRQNPKCSSANVIKHAFPMGSMTGAPKIRVMEEIEKLEDSARGLYSGAIGYFTPEGDFDFNVVIRSIVFDSRTGKMSFHAGSAITYDSDPEYEYNECLLKAESLFEVLSQPPF